MSSATAPDITVYMPSSTGIQKGAKNGPLEPFLAAKSGLDQFLQKVTVCCMGCSMRRSRTVFHFLELCYVSTHALSVSVGSPSLMPMQVSRKGKALHNKAVINCQFSMATFSTGQRKKRPRGDK